MGRSSLHLQVPTGVRDILPGEAKRKRQMESSFVDMFEQWGYQEVVTPTFEYFDALARGDNSGAWDQLYRFFDRDGRILALRPDITTPIARMVATRLRGNILPLRLFYLGNVFRYESPQAGRQREFTQAGVELIGARSAAADAEVITLAVRALENSGLDDFQIGVGQVEVFHGLMEEAELDEDTRRQVRESVASKDLVGLEECLERSGVPASLREVLLSLPSLHGGVEVLDRAMGMTDNKRALRGLTNLSRVFSALAAAGVGDRVIMDLGVLRGFDYYTGMVFEGYAPGLGFPVCGGGRYDQLLGKFGHPLPATGFAIGIERLMLAVGSLEQQAVGPDFLVAGKDHVAVSKKAQSLREQGFSAEVDLLDRTAEELIAYARERGIKSLIIKTGGDWMKLEA